MPEKIPILDEKDLNALIEQALNGNGILVTPKELSQMIIHLPGVSIGTKPRKDGRYQGYIYDRNGRTYAYGKTPDEVAEKLRLYLRHGTPKKKKAALATYNGIPATFNAFSEYYFENFRKKTVCAKTFTVDRRRYDRYLKPYFGERMIKRITPKDCQTLIERIEKEGKGKTADEIYSLLSVILKMAIKHGVIERNPLDVVLHIRHERKHGTALTKEEESKLKAALCGTPYCSAFMLALYTGLRPNELTTARIENGFIIAVNSKRKTRKVEYKKIPISKLLAPYIVGEEPPIIPNLDLMRRTVKAILPNHILYDLRTTFYSRLKECNVSQYAISEFMGHSLGAIGNAYTDLSDEFLIKEMKKLDY